ncbi:hypothetical protein [Elongatibacter sediminis]|uniref:SnoaL-like domain-containing protein n=1 Tax=Elongatibacter sediminis TaxID=3119006 RepID=A0AAW9REY4_9GAMM
MNDNPIVRMFEWWNTAITRPDGFTPEAFGNHFSADARLIVNGDLRGQGLDALARHFRNIQAEYDSVAMELPPLDTFACDGRAFVQVVTRAVRDGKVLREESMAVATLDGDRMSLLKVIGRSLD